MVKTSMKSAEACRTHRALSDSLSFVLCWRCYEHSSRSSCSLCRAMSVPFCLQCWGRDGRLSLCSTLQGYEIPFCLQCSTEILLSLFSLQGYENSLTFVLSVTGLWRFKLAICSLWAGLWDSQYCDPLCRAIRFSLPNVLSTGLWDSSYLWFYSAGLWAFSHLCSLCRAMRFSIDVLFVGSFRFSYPCSLCRAIRAFSSWFSYLCSLCRAMRFSYLCSLCRAMRFSLPVSLSVGL